MSKLYEALLQAKRDKTTLHDPSLSAPSRDGSAIRLELDTEMIALYHSLDNAFPGLDRKVVLFIGVKGGEGTSTVVSSLARVAAERFHRKVAVIDANTTHPTQHRLFGISPTVGWDDVLRGIEPTERALYPAVSDRLWIIPVSAAGARTDQVIGTHGIEAFFRALRERVDLVLIDGAPAMVFPDSVAFSGKANGVVLVIEAESTRWPVSQSVHHQITKAGGRVIGIVLNKRRYYIPEFVYRRL